MTDMALSLSALFRPNTDTAPPTSIPTPAIPYADELRILRSELDARLDALNHADPENVDACIYELIATETRMQVLIAKAQRADAIQRLERRTDEIKAKISDPEGGDTVALHRHLLAVNREIWSLMSAPIAPVDPVEFRRDLLASLRLGVTA